MTELFGRLAPGRNLDAALAELRTVHGAMVKAHPEAYQAQADYRIEARSLRDEIISPARTILLMLLAASGLVFIVACSNVANLILARSVRRQGELADSRGAWRQHGRAQTDAARREPAPLRRRRGARGRDRAADGGGAGELRRALLGARERRHRGREPALGGRRARHRGGGAAGVRAAGCRPRTAPTGRAWPAAASASRRARTGGCSVFAVTQIARVVRAGRGRRDAGDDALRAAAPADRLHAATCSR